jgi:hypothetical protein
MRQALGVGVTKCRGALAGVVTRVAKPALATKAFSGQQPFQVPVSS